jgi:ATP-dependent RNA helicase DeaD
MKFEDFKLSKETLSSIKRLGFDNPTQIQETSIPYILEGKDVIGESATGSGKTLAFGAGVIEKVLPGKGLQALILTPTRELAEQVRQSLMKISFNKKLSILSIYGGVAIDPQIKGLLKAEVVVATPGRFLDHLDRRTINNSRIKLLVLDEADRMFDMGFIDDIEKIIQVCPKNRQTLFFSATISPRVKKLAEKYMINPIDVAAKKHVDPSKLKQVYYDLPRNMKLSLLVNLLKSKKPGLVMIFCNTRKNTEFVSQNLKNNGIKAIAIHGGLTQNKRTRTLQMFNDNKVDVLVCTDVAARGLHIDSVSQIINYEIPRDPNDYVHRIGRTARAGEEGEVINIISGGQDYDEFSNILSTYRNFKIKKMDRPTLNRIFPVKVEEERSNFRRPSGNRQGYRSSGQNSGYKKNFSGRSNKRDFRPR